MVSAAGFSGELVTGLAAATHHLEAMRTELAQGAAASYAVVTEHFVAAARQAYDNVTAAGSVNRILLGDDSALALVEDLKRAEDVLDRLWRTERDLTRLAASDEALEGVAAILTRGTEATSRLEQTARAHVRELEHEARATIRAWHAAEQAAAPFRAAGELLEREGQIAPGASSDVILGAPEVVAAGKLRQQVLDEHLTVERDHAELLSLLGTSRW